MRDASAGPGLNRSGQWGVRGLGYLPAPASRYLRVLGVVSLNRIARATIVAILAGVLATLGAIAPALAAARVPKVVLIVGPVGSLTSSYRVQADKAARVAEASGAEVVRVYSPDATWPRVQHATEGASIVVYLGHGNGWPSRYRDSLYPPTQNGFGLNPVAGVDDSAHQYFGEASIGTLHLAPNAVVLLHHLCYASGNTEPGLAEGTQQQAIERVDNYAAGFLRAGARAVVAEGHLGPAYYVKALLAGRSTVEQIWRASPTANGNTLDVASVRSPGYTARLDPDRTSGGYFRSLVSAGLSALAVRSGATGTAGRTFVEPPQPSLASLGLRFGTPSLRALPVAGTATRLSLPLAKAASKVPRGAQVGVRWDPILLDPQPTASPSPAPSPSPSTDPSAGPTADPSASPGPLSDAPEVDLVVPEQLGSVVTPAQARVSANGLALDVRYPAAPGLYRLVPTLHTPEGVAYDAATQARLTPVIVRVGGPVAVAFGAPVSLSMAAGSSTTVAVRVVNAGTEVWDAFTSVPPTGLAEEILIWLHTSRAPARVVATWVSVTGADVPRPVAAALDPARSAPGGETAVGLELVAPAQAGDYLLLLDVISPAHGSLTALGNVPGLIRVTVSGTAATPSPSPSPSPPAATPPQGNATGPVAPAG